MRGSLALRLISVPAVVLVLGFASAGSAFADPGRGNALGHDKKDPGPDAPSPDPADPADKASDPAQPPTDPLGNNGTIKIDGLDWDDAPNNEPHPGCTFEVDFYGFDEGDLYADVVFEAHA